jgi:hypothetical protein
MMAHAIDIACADDRPTSRPRSARAIGTRSCGCGATRAGHSAARRGLQLRCDCHDDRMQFADDCPVEAALRAGRSGGIGRPPSRLEADRADAGPGSAHHDVDAPTAASWRDPLVHPVARPPAGCATHDGRARLAPRRPAAPSTRAVHAVDRSRIRDEGRGCDRLVSRSAAARRGVLHRRKDGDSSPRSAGPGPAVVARTRRTARLRVLPTGRCRSMRR